MKGRTEYEGIGPIKRVSTVGTYEKNGCIVPYEYVTATLTPRHETLRQEAVKEGRYAVTRVYGHAFPSMPICCAMTEVGRVGDPKEYAAAVKRAKQERAARG